MTTQNLLTEWLEIYQKEHIKARTYSQYQGLITMHIVPMLGDKNIDELGRREIQEFLTQQKKDGNIRNGEKLSATSTNMMLSILNLAFEYACDMEYIEENPCECVSSISTPCAIPSPFVPLNVEWILKLLPILWDIKTNLSRSTDTPVVYSTTKSK